MTESHRAKHAVDAAPSWQVTADYGELVPTERRARMLEATMTVVARDDVSGVTMDAIAKLANISRITLYREFGNRTELLEAAIAYRLMQFDRRFFERVTAPIGLADLVADYLLASIRISKRNAVTKRWTRGGMAFLRQNSSIHRTAVATWTPVIVYYKTKSRWNASISPEELASWISMLQYSFARLAIETDLDEPEMQRRIRVFVNPAFSNAFSSG